MNKEEWEDYKKLSGQITEKLDNISPYESWLIIQEYIDRCQQDNKKQKEENEFLKSEIEEAKRIFQKYLEYVGERDERIDKAIEYIKYNNETLYTYEPDYDYEENMVDNYDISNYREDLLEILKEEK